MKSIRLINQGPIAPSELVLNADRSVYHLALHPHQLADDVIVVGDPGRVAMISARFDRIDHRVEHREFVTHTGTFKGKAITALSTGIGTDNIDIVLNELDALRNINLTTREVNSTPNPLRIVRLGTSGALRSGLAPGSFVHSRYAIGFDGVMHFYKADYDADELQLAEDFVAHTGWNIPGSRPYAVRSDAGLGSLFTNGFYQGITVTSCGFYGPQGRVLRLPLSLPEINGRMCSFSFRDIPLANYEMESSALFGLGAMLGHACTTVCVVVANRIENAFLPNHKQAVSALINIVLDRLCGK